MPIYLQEQLLFELQTSSQQSVGFTIHVPCGLHSDPGGSPGLVLAALMHTEY